MNKKKNLSRYLDLHEYPALFYRYPILIRCIYFINFILTLRNWYVFRELRKLEKEKEEGFSFLDAGCGMGDFAVGVARRHRKSHVTGIDITATNTTLASCVSQSLNLKNIMFCQADLTAFLSDVKYDLILCNSTLQFIQEDKKALHTLYEVLEQSGTLLLYVPVRYQRYFPWSETFEKKYLSDFFYKYHEEFLMHRYSADELLKRMTDQGFIIRAHTYSYGTLGAIAFELYSTLLASLKILPLFISIALAVVYAGIIFPIQILLMLGDLLRVNKIGNGLLVVAEKNHSKKESQRV